MTTESLTNNIRSVRSICKIAIYHYVYQKKDDLESHHHKYTPYSLDTGDIVNLSFQKGYEEPSGTLVMRLLPTINYMRIISPGDWVRVTLTNSDIDSTRCLGIVNSITRSIVKNKDGRQNVVYEVNCSDFGKVLQRSTIWLNTYDGDQIFMKEFLINSYDTNIPHKADMILSKIIDVWLDPFNPVGRKYGNPFVVPRTIFDDMNLKYYSPNFNELLARKFYGYSDAGIKPIDTLEMRASLWTILKSYINPVLNEVFTEMIGEPGKEQPALILRPYPFSSDNYYGEDSVPFSRLVKSKRATIEITKNDIISSKYGYSDNINFNIFYLLSSEKMNKNLNAMGVFEGTDLPKVFYRSTQRFGKRVFDRNTNYLPRSRESLIAWNRQLIDMHKDVSLMYSGMIRIIGNPRTRIGKILKIKNISPGIDLVFYIFGYNDTWNYPGLWIQNVNIGRGQYYDTKSEKLILPYDFEKDNEIFTGQTIIDNIRSPFSKPKKAQKSKNNPINNIEPPIEKPEIRKIEDIVTPTGRITDKTLITSKAEPTGDDIIELKSDKELQKDKNTVSPFPNDKKIKVDVDENSNTTITVEENYVTGETKTTITTNSSIGVDGSAIEINETATQTISEQSGGSIGQIITGENVPDSSDGVLNVSDLNPNSINDITYDSNVPAGTPISPNSPLSPLIISPGNPLGPKTESSSIWFISSGRNKK